MSISRSLARSRIVGFAAGLSLRNLASLGFVALLMSSQAPVWAQQGAFPKRISLPSQYGQLWEFASVAPFGEAGGARYYLSATDTQASYTAGGAYVQAPQKYTTTNDVIVSPSFDPTKLIAFKIDTTEYAFGVFNAGSLTPVFQYKTGLPGDRSYVLPHPAQLGFYVVLDQNETIEVVHLNGSGAQVWAKRLSSSEFGVPNRETFGGLQFASAIPNADGGILLYVLKTILAGGTPETETVIIKLSSAGAVEWAKHYIGILSAPTYDLTNATIFVQETKDGGALAKLDANGNTVWSKRASIGNLAMFAQQADQAYVRVETDPATSTNRFAVLNAAGTIESQFSFTVQGADEGVLPAGVRDGVVWFNELGLDRRKPIIGWANISSGTAQARRYEKNVDSTTIQVDPMTTNGAVLSFFSEADQAVDVIPVDTNLIINAPCTLLTNLTVTPAGNFTVQDSSIPLDALTVTSADFTASFPAASLTLPTNVIESITLNESSVCTANSDPAFPNPTLTAFPEDGIVEVGGFASLIATAPTGVINPTWQWKHNGEVLPGETAQFLTLSDMTKEMAGLYTVVMSSGGQSAEASFTITVPAAVSFTVSPQSQIVPAGSSITLNATATALGGSPITYQWLFNGAAVAGATTTSLTIPAVTSAQVGAYTAVATSGANSATSAPAIVGLETTAKALGSVYEHTGNIQHPNGNVYDQFLLTGTAATITADNGQIARLSFLDTNDDIVQLEFSGPGVLTVQMVNATGPATPTKYNQPTVQYMKGRVSLTLTGATENTHLGIFAVGTITNPNPALYVAGATYDGFADLGSISIQSPTNRFAGVRIGSTRLSAETGNVGLIAPGVRFAGPLNLHNVSASGTATPHLLTGEIDTGRISITGGDMLQANGRAIIFGHAQQVAMVAGSSSHGVSAPAKTNLGTYERDGVDVTAAVVINP